MIRIIPVRRFALQRQQQRAVQAQILLLCAGTAPHAAARLERVGQVQDKDLLLRICLSQPSRQGERIHVHTVIAADCPLMCAFSDHPLHPFQIIRQKHLRLIEAFHLFLRQYR